MATQLNNFIPINRKLFKHEFWLQKRIYSRFEAWLDMLVTARFDNSEGRMLVGSTVVRWNRGQLLASVRFLGTRWGWSISKVDRFLKQLRTEGMIETETATGTPQTVITICNYDTYNSVAKKAEHPTEQQRYGTDTAPIQERYKTNKANKEQKSEQREIYRAFAHLCLFTDEYCKLIDSGYSRTKINGTLDAIENYRGNKNYTSLYLTAKQWLGKKEQVAGPRGSQSAASGRIVNIAGAFQDALQHG